MSPFKAGEISDLQQLIYSSHSACKLLPMPTTTHMRYIKNNQSPVPNNNKHTASQRHKCQINPNKGPLYPPSQTIFTNHFAINLPNQRLNKVPKSHCNFFAFSTSTFTCNILTNKCLPNNLNSLLFTLAQNTIFVQKYHHQQQIHFKNPCRPKSSCAF